MHRCEASLPVAGMHLVKALKSVKRLETARPGRSGHYGSSHKCLLEAHSISAREETANPGTKLVEMPRAQNFPRNLDDDEYVANFLK